MRSLRIRAAKYRARCRVAVRRRPTENGRSLFDPESFVPLDSPRFFKPLTSSQTSSGTALFGALGLVANKPSTSVGSGPAFAGVVATFFAVELLEQAVEKLGEELGLDYKPIDINPPPPPKGKESCETVYPGFHFVLVQPGVIS